MSSSTYSLFPTPAGTGRSVSKATQWTDDGPAQPSKSDEGVASVITQENIDFLNGKNHANCDNEQTSVKTTEDVKPDAAPGTDQPESKPGKKAPPASIAPDKPPVMRSMFPIFDAEKPLNEQYYLPSQMSPSHIPYEAVVKSPFSAVFNMEEKDSEKAGLVFEPSGTQLDDGFTPDWELPTLWRLSRPTQDYRLRMQVYRGEKDKAKRQTKWRKGRMPTSQLLLGFGPSPFAPVVSVCSRPANGAQARTLYSVQKPRSRRFTSRPDSELGQSDVLADFRLKGADLDKASQLTKPPQLESGIEIITSFLLRAPVADSPQTPGNLMTPDAYSAECIGENRDCDDERPRCYIVLRSYPGQRRPCYALKHPTLNFMRLKVHGELRIPDTDTKAPEVGKVELLAPIKDDVLDDEMASNCSATQAPEPEIVLASIDVANTSLFIDGAAIADVNEAGLIDMAISALVAVLLAENHTPRLSQPLTFAPPPGEVTLQRAKSGIVPFGKTTRLSKLSKKQKAEDEAEQALSTIFGVLAAVLGVAIEKLGALNDKGRI